MKLSPFLWCIALTVFAGQVCAQQTAEKKEIRLPMTLSADQRTELHARIEGYVAKVHVDIGDRVETGQVLVTLDAPELVADVQRRRQLVVQSQANLRVAQGMVTTAEAKLRQAGSARDEQEALKKLRLSERDRYLQLVRGGAVQAEKYDEAQFAVLAVEAAVAKIDADVDAAGAEVEAAKNEVEFAKAGIMVAEAELAQALAKDQLRQISAPFDGVVTDRQVDPGRLVSIGGSNPQPLLVIERVAVLRGVMTVPAGEAALVQVGDEVSLTGFGNGSGAVAPDGGKPKVSRMSQSLHRKTRTMRIEIDIQNTLNEKTGRYRFLSGQYGQATVKIRKQP